MKPWPENDEPVPLEDLVKPLVSALWNIIGMADSKYDGYDVGDRHINVAADWSLSPEGLAWLMEDQGIGEIQTALTVAVQLGIEQGRRIEKQKQQAAQAIKDVIAMSDETLEAHFAQD